MKAPYFVYADEFLEGLTPEQSAHAVKIMSSSAENCAVVQR